MGPDPSANGAQCLISLAAWELRGAKNDSERIIIMQSQFMIYSRVGNPGALLSME